MPVNGYAMDVGLVEFSPVREVLAFGLLGNYQRFGLLIIVISAYRFHVMLTVESNPCLE